MVGDISLLSYNDNSITRPLSRNSSWGEGQGRHLHLLQCIPSAKSTTSLASTSSNCCDINFVPWQFISSHILLQRISFIALIVLIAPSLGLVYPVMATQAMPPDVCLKWPNGPLVLLCPFELLNQILTSKIVKSHMISKVSATFMVPRIFVRSCAMECCIIAIPPYHPRSQINCWNPQLCSQQPPPKPLEPLPASGIHF